MSFLDNPLARLVVAVAVGIVFFSVIILFLPSGEAWAFPATVASALAWLINGIYSFDWLIPVGTLIFAFTVIISLEVILFSFKIIIWLKDFLTKN